MGLSERRETEAWGGQGAIAPAVAAAMHDRIRHLEREVARQRALLAQHEELTRRAAAASEAKSRFLATVSHEVRTPLSGVLGMAELVLDTPLSPEQATYVEAIKTSGEALLSLIDEILDFSRIEAGKVTLASEPVDLHGLLEGVAELMAPRAQGKGIDLGLSIAPGVPRFVEADAARLRQMLLNLAGNAVKFTDRGGVGIDVSGRGGGLVFAVEDTGIGIPPDRLPRVFEEFEQVDPGDQRGSGTGLGLAITARLAAQMGGSVAVESAPGVGSTFTLRLPLAAVPDAAAPEAPPRPAPGAGALVLAASGPGAYGARYLARRLAECGYAVTLEDPAEAGRRSMAVIAFVDAALGQEAAAAALAIARQRGASRVFVLLSPFERRAFGAPRDAGFDGYLTKPVRTRSLYARLTGEDAASHGGHRRRPVSAVRLPLLIAEDNPINALLAARMVERLGHHATVVARGDAALEALSVAAGAPSRFAAALVDLRMPGLDGLALARALRAHERALGQPPLRLVAFTANASREDERACLAAGFDRFVSKPPTLETLAAALEGLDPTLAVA